MSMPILCAPAQDGPDDRPRVPCACCQGPVMRDAHAGPWARLLCPACFCEDISKQREKWGGEFRGGFHSQRAIEALRLYLATTGAPN